MIIVVTYWSDKTKQLIVSHGVDVDTMQTVVLPNVPLREIGASWDDDTMEWVL